MMVRVCALLRCGGGAVVVVVVVALNSSDWNRGREATCGGECRHCLHIAFPPTLCSGMIVVPMYMYVRQKKPCAMSPISVL